MRSKEYSSRKESASVCLKAVRTIDAPTYDTSSDYIRRCSICGKEMREGYFINDDEYYCSTKCLNEVYTDEEYNKIYEEDGGYWTEWEE